MKVLKAMKTVSTRSLEKGDPLKSGKSLRLPTDEDVVECMPFPFT